MTQRNTLLRQVKSYIDKNVNPTKLNWIDPSKVIFTQPLSVKLVLVEFEIPEDDYRKAFSV